MNYSEAERPQKNKSIVDLII